MTSPDAVRLRGSSTNSPVGGNRDPSDITDNGTQVGMRISPDVVYSKAPKPGGSEDAALNGNQFPAPWSQVKPMGQDEGAGVDSGPCSAAGGNNGRAYNSGSKCTLRRLMHRHELPKHLQFNPYIDTGYRPLLSAWECILSLFYLHNETVNIITHGVPMLYIFFMWRSMVPWEEIKIPVLPYIHLMSCVSPWVGSTIYHMFMNHRAGESCYRSLLHLDMFGIWITQSFGALTTVYASVSCLGSGWVWSVLAGYCLVSFWCLHKASHARNPWERRFCFTLPFLMRAASVFLRVSSSGGGNPDAFRHIILQDFLAVIGGFVGALRIPEKWIPGRLDMLANSHHIMHVVVVWAVYHLHQGAILDLIWLSKNPQCHGVMDPKSLL